MIKRSFINTLPSQLKTLILDNDDSDLDQYSSSLRKSDLDISSVVESTDSSTSTTFGSPDLEDNLSENSSENSNSNSNSNSPSLSASSDDAASINSISTVHSFDSSILNILPNIDSNAKFFLLEKILEQKGIIFTEFNSIKLKLFDVDSTLNPFEFDKLVSKLDSNSRILLCEKIKLIYGFNSLISFIIRLINILNFSTFFSIFDITSNIKLYGFYSLSYNNPVEILIKQIRKDLFIVKSFKEFTIQEMKKEHDFHLPYKEFKRLNLNNGNLVVVKILFKNEQKSIDLSLIKPFLSKMKMLHLSLENESKLKPFNDLIDQYGSNLEYLKFGVNRGTFKKIPNKNNINTLKLVNIDNLNFINDIKDCSSLDVFFDNWELRNNCDIKFQSNFIINFQVNQQINNLKTLNIFHTYIDSKDLNKLKYFPNLTHSKISYVILDDNGFDLRECKKLQELKIHFTYQKLLDDLNGLEDDTVSKYSENIHWPQNLKKLSITIHNIKNLIQNFSIRLNILRKIAKPLPPSIVDLCIDISYDTGGSGPELYSISRDDILKISNLINIILTNNLENLKLKGISRYNYKIGKPLIFSAINFPKSLKLLSLNDFILDYNFLEFTQLKKLYFEHSLFDFNFKLPNSEEILIEKCTFKDLSYVPATSSKIEFKMCTFRKVPSYSDDVSNIVINNCRVMEQPTNNTFQFQQQLQAKNTSRNLQTQPNIQISSPPLPQTTTVTNPQSWNLPPLFNNGYQQIPTNFMTKELEMQLSALSLSSGSGTPTTSNTGAGSITPVSPPLSSTESLGMHTMQKRADSFNATASGPPISSQFLNRSLTTNTFDLEQQRQLHAFAQMHNNYYDSSFISPLYPGQGQSQGQVQIQQELLGVNTMNSGIDFSTLNIDLLNNFGGSNNNGGFM
ncbi:hypothetical protein CANINC_002097 [Pichia inconspicua]|uniref:Uncharacterized protein n=1 Tax=Pichia inconspicua TaxID=52247 RepID=A0A4T0X216_9ASCO|nr:hypothetical protein CANINC_002097 [[Candida] inconspicua]